MGKGNVQKAAMARAKNQAKAAKAGGGGGGKEGMAKRAASLNIVCTICRQPFPGNTSKKMAEMHLASKHSKNTFTECFPDFPNN